MKLKTICATVSHLQMVCFADAFCTHHGWKHTVWRQARMRIVCQVSDRCFECLVMIMWSVFKTPVASPDSSGTMVMREWNIRYQTSMKKKWRAEWSYFSTVYWQKLDPSSLRCLTHPPTTSSFSKPCVYHSVLSWSHISLLKCYTRYCIYRLTILIELLNCLSMLCLFIFLNTCTCIHPHLSIIMPHLWAKSFSFAHLVGEVGEGDTSPSKHCDLPKGNRANGAVE